MKLIFQLLVLSLLLSTIVPGQEGKLLPSDKKTKTGSLELPPFSIFGLTTSEVPEELDKPLSPAELEQFLTVIKKKETEDKTGGNHRPYWIIPLALFKSRNLFAKDTWSMEDIEQGQQVSQLIAKLTDKPDLEIKASGQEDFRKGLMRLRDWFAAMCQDNETLASMMFTMDDGPFFGADLDVRNFPKMKLIESVQIPGNKASFVLLTDGNQPEPMVIGIINEDKSVRWLKRYSNSPDGRITKAWFHKPAISIVDGYGYEVTLMTQGSSGAERSQVYLDDLLNLRFFYVSW